MNRIDSHFNLLFELSILDPGSDRNDDITTRGADFTKNDQVYSPDVASSGRSWYRPVQVPARDPWVLYFEITQELKRQMVRREAVDGAKLRRVMSADAPRNQILDFMG